MAPRRKKTDQTLKSIWDETLLTEFLIQNGTSVKHATKIWNWMLQRPEASISDVPMESWCIPKRVCDGIRSTFVKFTTTLVDRVESSRGDTTKLLIELQDGGHRIEAVIMRHTSHVTVCISSQIGCQMGCKFCATGTMGIIGDLTSAEILEQIIRANNVSKIRNVVFMGMGEPLNNYENVKLALQFIVDPKRLGLSPKHVTVSTVGVIKNMYRLTADLPSVNLALSLHAPTQELRIKIVPTASAYKIDDLMKAVDNHINMQTKTLKPSLLEKYFSRLKSNNVMIEYILIRDINDKDEHAHELGKLLTTRRNSILLNLIPYNPTSVAEDFEPPLEEQVQRFFQICTSPEYRIFTRIRQEMGQDIAGACGQLALVNPKSRVINDSTDASLISDIEDIATKKKPTMLPSNTDKHSQKNSNHSHKSDTSSGVIDSSGFAFVPLSSLGILVGAVVVAMIAIPLLRNSKFLR